MQAGTETVLITSLRDRIECTGYLKELLSKIVYVDKSEPALLDHIYNILKNDFSIEQRAIETAGRFIKIAGEDHIQPCVDELCVDLKQWLMAFLQTDDVIQRLRDALNIDIMYRVYMKYEDEFCDLYEDLGQAF